MTDDMFARAAFEDAKFDFYTKERTVKDYFVSINGVVFDLDELYDFIGGLASGDGLYWTGSSKGGEVLLELRVLNGLGGRDWSASEGDNFDAFWKTIKETYENM